jgi:hypothetical protein
VTARSAEFSARTLGDFILDWTTTGLCFEVIAQSSGSVDFAVPVDGDVKAMIAEEVLFGFALKGTGHITRGDRDEMLGA